MRRSPPTGVAITSHPRRTRTTHDKVMPRRFATPLYIAPRPTHDSMYISPNTLCPSPSPLNILLYHSCCYSPSRFTPFLQLSERTHLASLSLPHNAPYTRLARTHTISRCRCREPRLTFFIFVPLLMLMFRQSAVPFYNKSTTLLSSLSVALPSKVFRSISI